ncbi:PLP-dependent aminotransferase family protein [Cohnella hashimotonis]|uniref:PLP-dependent aminotransferase family protein n=1 Tax=Cohnella hashimotonis TaxID=2826895 RepID=A0ABT6TAT5_9BACL|nr:PLP-dependent aminotransferase family protein [Cohnella hashimotonis]MDI4643681.1 PLP-dependent aminotransferase family protein [Cohnella hashimotonis]
MTNKKQAVISRIRSDIVDGLVIPGQKLPSIREQSQAFSCSLNTIISAYQELEREHLIYSRPKSGYYVVAQEALLPLLQKQRIDFTSAAPAPSSLSQTDFRQCLNKAMALFEDSIFTYPDPQGLLSLRQEMVQLFHKQQVFSSERQIFVFSGAQQALHLLNGMPFPNGKTNILVEQPTYWGMLESLKAQNQTVIGIERTPEGIDWTALERHFQSNMIKFFYTIPRFHNPLGTSYTPKEKQRIADLAQKYDVYIVEDDYLADFETDSKADPIWAYGGSSHVLYLRSFSKVMLPGLRLAAAAVPKTLVPSLQQHKRTADLSTSVLSQGVLEIFMQSGMYAHHAKRMRAMYGQRMRKLKEASSRLLPKAFLYSIPSSGGIFAAINLPGIHTEELAKRLSERGVDVLRADQQFLPTFPKPNLLRMSMMRTDEQEIEKGIQTIAEELDHAKLTDNDYTPSFWI